MENTTKESPITKFESALMDSCTIAEACLFSEWDSVDFAQHCSRNPGYLERCELLRNWPTIKARKSLSKGVETDPDLALKYLERKKKDEFSTKVENELTGKGGKDLFPPLTDTQKNELIKLWNNQTQSTPGTLSPVSGTSMEPPIKSEGR